MVERIKDLCASRGIRLANLEKTLGFANGSLAKSDEKIQSARLRSIAQYFGVSMEYLLIGSEAGPAATPAVDGMPLSADELRLVRGFRKAVGPVRKAMLDMANDALEASGARSAGSMRDQSA